jgi:hypothetical protein
MGGFSSDRLSHIRGNITMAIIKVKPQDQLCLRVALVCPLSQFRTALALRSLSLSNCPAVAEAVCVVFIWVRFVSLSRG